MSRRSWTAEEDAAVRRYSDLTAEDLGRMLNRSALSVSNRRKRFPAAQSKGNRTTPWHVGRRSLVARTCITCDRLLDGSWFLSHADGWQQRCRNCKVSLRARSQEERAQNKAQVQARRAALQTETLRSASRSGLEWSSQELALLDDPSLTRLQVAKMTGRTLHAVDNKRRGLPDRRSLPPPPMWNIRRHGE